MVRNLLSKSINHEICENRGTNDFDCEIKLNITDVPASIYDRKTAARPFDTIHDILQSLSLVQSLLSGRNASNFKAHMGLPGIDGLS